MEKIVKKILIVGDTAKDYALIQRLLNTPDYDVKIFITSANNYFSTIATCIDIRKNKSNELLKFAIENKIDMTIVTDELAIKSDITGIFSANNQHIFAPTISACETLINKAECKKFLYKMHIKTPKFAIFEKESLAIDYLNKTQYPIIISCNGNNDNRFAVPTIAIAKTFIEDLFFRGEQKVIIEDFIYGHECSFYYVTDGYKVLPIGTCGNYKFMSDNDGGILTDGIGCYAPDFKITQEIEKKVTEQTSRILMNLEAEGTPYCGIIGVDCVLTRTNEIMTLGFSTFLKDHNTNAIMNLIDENLYKLFEACINGYFADDYETIETNDMSSVSCILDAKLDNKEISGLDTLEDNEIAFAGVKTSEDNKLFTTKNQKLVITKTAKTLAQARKNLNEDIDFIKFDGKNYRKDICKIN